MIASVYGNDKHTSIGVVVAELVDPDVVKDEGGTHVNRRPHPITTAHASSLG